MKIYVKENYLHFGVQVDPAQYDKDKEQKLKKSLTPGELMAILGNRDSTEFVNDGVPEFFIEQVSALCTYLGQYQNHSEKTLHRKVRTDFISYLNTDLDNSTPKTAMILNGLYTGSVYTGARTHVAHLCSNKIALHDGVRGEGAKFLLLEDGILFEGKFENNSCREAEPIRFFDNNVCCMFENSLLKRVKSISSDKIDIQYEGRLPRKMILKDMELDFYLSGKLRYIRFQGQEWKVYGTSDKKPTLFSLPDRIGGQDTLRPIGSLHWCVNTKTKQKIVLPDDIGEAWLMNNAADFFLQEKIDPPEYFLSAVRSMIHVEAKRIIMRKVGLEKFLKNAKTLDVDIDSSIHRALVVDTYDNQKYLLCHDGSTKKMYYISVPDNDIDAKPIESCKQAAAQLSVGSLPRDTWRRSLPLEIIDIASNDNFIAES